MNSFKSAAICTGQKHAPVHLLFRSPWCETACMQGTFFHEAEAENSFRRRSESRFMAARDRVREVQPDGWTARVRPAGTWMPELARVIGGTAKMGVQSSESRNQGQKMSKGALQRMNLAGGGRISCHAGNVWITLDGGGEDIVLAAGQSRNFGPGTRALVEALSPSWVLVEAP
jgi:hypothetical protein